MMALGYGLRKGNIVSKSTMGEVNRLAYLIFIPMLLFKNIYKEELAEVLNVKLIVFLIAGILAVLAGSILITLLAEKDPRTRGAMIQGMYRSNFTIFGLPIVIFLFGEANTGVTSFLIAILAPMYNIICIIVLEIFRGGRANRRKMFFSVLSNPFMIGTLLGVLVMLSGIHFPTFIESSIDTFASLALPMSLISMGASFTPTTVKAKTRNLILTVAMRLVGFPVVFLTICILAGFRDLELATMLILFASPTAIVSYTMAVQMDSDGDFACAVVIFTTLFSGITVFLWLFFLQYFSFIVVP